MKFKETMDKIENGTVKDLAEITDLWPKSWVELEQIIQALINRTHDYNTCVHGMSLAALAAFNFVASTLGTTGFQSSCADLNFLTKTRHMKLGFNIFKHEDLLYPQNREKFPTFDGMISKNIEALGKEAAKHLKNDDSYMAPEVKSHMEMILKKATEKRLEGKNK